MSAKATPLPKNNIAIPGKSKQINILVPTARTIMKVRNGKEVPNRIEDL